MDKTKIEAMRKGGQILGEVLEALRDYADVGMTKRELDIWTRKEIVKRGGEVGYDFLPKSEEFPGAICISVNEELVHGAPNSDYVLENGDKVSFDLVVKYKGYFTDAAFTKVVGKANPAVAQMVKTTEKALWAGIDEVGPGVPLGNIGFAVEKVLRKGHLGVIENYIGHGIGKEMHMGPEVPNYGKRGKGYVLKPGDCICIEPMSSLGKPQNHVDAESGWSVILNDGSVGCHCEHTILVTEDGYEVLTLPNCPRK
ncbi:MAG: type I methionyl aminopeptidase [Candidatus Saccharibacteria bacterium]|nr:type I methionyl aminopeptidase [Candidatus Saccharibacteria bacterium]